MGFSQGACMAAILSSLVCHFLMPSSFVSFSRSRSLPLSFSSPLLSWKQPADNQLINQNAHPSFPPHPSLIAPKFLISVGGFLPVPKEPDLSHLFPLPSTLPTLHVVGRNDIVVTEEKSRTLWEKCENSRVEYHDGGTSYLCWSGIMLTFRPLYTIKSILEAFLQVS